MSAPHKPFNSADIYGYTPTQWSTVLFIVLFTLTALAHGWQAIRYRTWWMLPTVTLCAAVEAFGWGGRLWSAMSPSILGPYIMQVCALLFAPVFLTAATFTILGKIIPRLGAQYSWLSPRMYLIIFITADVFALFIQSTGGAKLATGASDGKGVETGRSIMVGGIIFQMVAVTLFVLCAADFLLRYHFDRPARTTPPKQQREDPSVPAWGVRGSLDRGTSLMIIGLMINTSLIYIRSIYRTAELLQGFDGSISSNELLFSILDGLPILAACVTFNVFHPGALLQQGSTYAPVSRRDARGGDDTPNSSSMLMKDIVGRA